jgi:hypothetical protein
VNSGRETQPQKLSHPVKYIIERRIEMIVIKDHHKFVRFKYLLILFGIMVTAVMMWFTITAFLLVTC